MLLTKKVNVPTKYSDLADVYSKKSANVLSEQIGANEHAFKLKKGNEPPYGPIYSIGQVEPKTFKTYIKINLANSFIQVLKSPARAPILFVHKPHGSLGLYVNYPGLNNLTIKNWYSLPLIGKSLNWLGHAKRFTQLDFTSVYNQIRIKEGNEWKTVFRTRYGHFEYQVMHFGLSNILASFQGYINKILAKKLDIIVIVYLDNMFIYNKDQGKAYVNAIWWLLKELRKNSLFANLKKYRFQKDKICFLEYVVSTQRVWIEEEIIDAMKNWPKPKSIYDIQVFLGFANFYCCFIQGFSRIIALLTSMLKMSSTPTTQKSIDVVDEFGRGDCGENEARKISALTKRPTGAYYLFFDHVSHAVSNFVSNFAKNISNYLISDAKKAFDQLRQAFTKALIL